MPKKQRRQLDQVLRTALRDDPVETSVVGWTPLGHIELQRKRERVPVPLRPHDEGGRHELSDLPQACSGRLSPILHRRCADVDLGRWLTGSYAIPVEDDDPDGTEDTPDPPDGPQH